MAVLGVVPIFHADTVCDSSDPFQLSKRRSQRMLRGDPAARLKRLWRLCRFPLLSRNGTVRFALVLGSQQRLTPGMNPDPFRQQRDAPDISIGVRHY